MNKYVELSKISKEIEQCALCKRGKIGKAVSGEGNPNAKIVFIGEAPGKKEAETGRPFVGRSGKLLRETIRLIGLKEGDVYITSPVKYLPTRGTPSVSDIVHGRTHLFKQLEVIRPRLLVLMGSVAVQAVLGRKIPIHAVHGNVITENGRTCFITFHPAAALRFPKTRELFKKDFATLRKRALQ